MSGALLALSGVRQSYGAVEALRGIDLEVCQGDVLALCGDNGAGKSSLIRIMAGAQEPTAGTLALAGRPVRFRSPQEALRQGVATIYQDLALAPRLSIAQNIFLGAEHRRRFLGTLDKPRMAREARGYLARLSVDVTDMDRPVERLSGGQRQAVAISRALRWDARIIIMDEPTAALGVRETQLVLDLIGRLKAEGRTIILISHNMADVVRVATRVVLLKGGAKVADRPLGDLDADRLAHMIMTGREN